MNDLRSQTALVSGASRGIGRAIALKLAESGADVCLLGRKLESLTAVAEEVRRHGAGARCYQVDVSQQGELENLVARLSREVEQLDVLVHSAGVITLGSLEELSLAAFDEQMGVNVRAPFLLTQALLPKLRRRPGQVVFVNSTVVQAAARASLGVYAATKHALKAIADSLREEVNADGIRVFSVYPGRTATSMQAAVHEFEERAYHPERLMQPETVAATVLAALLLGRDAEVTDLYVRPLQKPV